MVIVHSLSRQDIPEHSGGFFFHYENTPVQYTAIFHVSKNEISLDKKLINFLIFAQNIDCGYSLEPHIQTIDCGYTLRRF